MPVTPFSEEWQLRALIARMGFTNHLTRDVQQVLDYALRDVAAQLLGSLSTRSTDRRRLQALYQSLQTLLNEAYGRAGQHASAQLLNYGHIESTITRRAVQHYVGSLAIPSRTQIVAASNLLDIVRNIDVGGVAFGEWWQKGAVDSLARVRRVVQTGLVTGKGPAEIARQVYAADRNTRSVARLTRIEARTIVRTAVTAVQSEASLAEYRASTGIAYVRYEAILDARTSKICIALDNRVWAVDDPKLVTPPAHPNCRSTLVPIPNEEALGITRGTLDPGAARMTYDTWLRSQPASIQNAILGRTRAELFRSGRITLADLIGNDRRVLTLAELYARLDAMMPTPSTITIP